VTDLSPSAVRSALARQLLQTAKTQIESAIAKLDASDAAGAAVYCGSAVASVRAAERELGGGSGQPMRRAAIVRRLPTTADCFAAGTEEDIEPWMREPHDSETKR
jgi:hypothetical protein